MRETYGVQSSVMPKGVEHALALRAEQPRYRVQRLDSRHAAESVARQALAAGRRVLWVLNTVDRCQELAQTLPELGPICYHSRFTLDDRKDRHAKVIDAFQSDDTEGRFAITTQVCEMSLDLDAHVLISEQAPIPALIQRMGRCNRRATPKTDRLGEVYIYAPEADAPYQPNELATVPEFIGEIADRTVSQSLLEALLEHYTQSGGNEADRWTAFIDDGPWACGGAEDLRDSPDVSVQAVVDIEAYLRLSRAKEPTDGLVVPIPKYLAEPDARLPRHLRRTPAEHYDPTLGFMKHPVETGVLSV